MAKRRRLRIRGPKVANKFTYHYPPDFLQVVGPLIAASWHVPAAHQDELRRRDLPIPSPVIGHLLLDTGASKTCISSAAAATLGLKSIGKVRGYGAGGMHTNEMVAARLEIAIEDHRGLMTRMWWEMPCQAIPDLEKHPATCDARIHGEPVSLVGLLWRDLLRLASVMYNGKKGTLEVVFDPDWIRSRDVGATTPEEFRE